MNSWERRPGVASRFRRLGLSALALAATACGGGGGSSVPGFTASPGPLLEPWVPGQFRPAATFAAYCEVPRSGVDPSTGLPFADRPGSQLHENNWLRSWSNDYYLWYDEIVDRNPANYSTPAYFDLLRTFELTPSGREKDRFHYSFPTDVWQAQAQSGITAGYGVQWAILAGTPPREVVVAYTHSDSPGGDALMRGTQVLAIDGISVVLATTASEIEFLNAALFPAVPGVEHNFEVRDPGAAESRSVTLTSAIVQIQPVQHVSVLDTAYGRVGYLHFTDHIATAEQQLIDAMTMLAAEQVHDLVLDIRYNSGGFLAIASELAYMVAGPAATAGRTFERQRFNNKHANVHPFTGAAVAPLPFLNVALGLSAPPGTPLPTLNLSRVFVLTGGATCSASESLINSLRGVDVEVIQIGTPTCGKPYGFYPADNCGTTYFSIQFQVENEKGFGDFGEGFTPLPDTGPPGATTPGCLVFDRFMHELGDPQEVRLAAALEYRISSSCSGASGAAVPHLSKPADAAIREPVIPKPFWLQERIEAPLP